MMILTIFFTKGSSMFAYNLCLPTPLISLSSRCSYSQSPQPAASVPPPSPPIPINPRTTIRSGKMRVVLTGSEITNVLVLSYLPLRHWFVLFRVNRQVSHLFHLLLDMIHHRVRNLCGGLVEECI
jgi:hypothetical protein